MDAIDIMVNEHGNIRRMLKVIRAMCVKVLNNQDINYGDFYKVVDFVRNYADKHHHGKEEAILFKRMGEELGERIAKGPIAGMLIEHDLGRLYMSNLENAIKRVEDGDMDSRVDVIANSIGYADLLNRHIDKENTAIYNFARRALSKEAMEDIQRQCEEAESKADEGKIQDNYIKLLEEFEKKFL